eukprot:8192067-Pyramimonas_sp.AAC.1
MSGVQRHGGCATVAFRLGFTQLDDPLMFGRLDLVKSWLEVAPQVGWATPCLSNAWACCRRAIANAKFQWCK